MDAVLIRTASFRMTWTLRTAATTQTASDKTRQINGFFLTLSVQELVPPPHGSPLPTSTIRLSTQLDGCRGFPVSWQEDAAHPSFDMYEAALIRTLAFNVSYIAVAADRIKPLCGQTQASPHRKTPFVYSRTTIRASASLVFAGVSPIDAHNPLEMFGDLFCCSGSLPQFQETPGNNVGGDNK